MKIHPEVAKYFAEEGNGQVPYEDYDNPGWKRKVPHRFPLEEFKGMPRKAVQELTHVLHAMHDIYEAYESGMVESTEGRGAIIEYMHDFLDYGMSIITYAGEKEGGIELWKEDHLPEEEESVPEWLKPE